MFTACAGEEPTDGPTGAPTATATMEQGGTPTQPTGGTATQPSGETPTQGSGETPTQGSGETPTQGSGETPTQGAGDTPTQPPVVTPTQGSGDTPTQPQPTPTLTPGTPTVASTLYERLGEEAGIQAVIGDFLGRVLADPKINGYFLNDSLNATALSDCLVKQVGEAVGGPQVYDCRSMAEAHEGLGISSVDFDDLVGHLVDELTERGVAPADIATIGGVLNSQQMRDDIIEDVPNNATVYQRVGRKPAIQSVVGSLITRVVSDTEINGFFGSTDGARLTVCLVRQVCSIDGPCVYGHGTEAELNGTACRDMAASHNGLTDANDSSPITIDDFNALVGHLVDALDEFSVPQGDKDAILGALGPLCTDIVAEPSSCAAPTPTPPTTLYQRLGGHAGIETAIGGFLGRVLADPKINGYFLNDSLNASVLSDCLVKQVGAAVGGPEVYDCRSMAEAHDGLGISTSDFDDLVNHLVDELTDLGVAPDDIATIGGVLTSQTMKDDIIEDPTNDATVYQRVGRKPAIQTVVGDLITRVVADTEINGFFGSTDADRLGVCLVRQVCSIDGPCDYGHGTEEELDGTACRDMASSHTGLTDANDSSPITIDDFDALVGHLVDAMNQAGVSGGDKDAILGALGPLCQDIVANPGDCAPVPTPPMTPTPGVTPTPSPTQPEPTVPDTLYGRLGGHDGIVAVVNTFVNRVVADSKINGYFLNSSVDGSALVDCLVKQIGAAVGGPEVYDCRSMAEAHAGLGISQLDFNDLVDHLVDVLDEAGVAGADIDTIGGVLTSQQMITDIVEDPSNDATVYQRIGRKPAVMLAVDGLITRIAGDASLIGFFNTQPGPLARLDTCLVRQVCSIDGPCIYGEGVEQELDGSVCRDMMAAHSGLTDSNDSSPITIEDFNALVTHLVDELTSLSVQEGDINAILGALAPLCSDIVANPADCSADGPLETDDLIISEYTEPSGGNNKALEIYNGTGATVDLMNYSIGKVTNGGNWVESSFTFASSTPLAAGDVYVLCHSSSAFDPDPCDVKNSFFDFNGDDAVGLYHGSDRIDQVGDEGADPGDGWDVAGVSLATKDHTLLRKGVSSGNTNWAASAGTTEENSEWVVRPFNENDDLGVPPTVGGPPPPEQ